MATEGRHTSTLSQHNSPRQPETIKGVTLLPFSLSEQGNLSPAMEIALDFSLFVLLKARIIIQGDLTVRIEIG